MSYDLRRLRLHGLIERIPRTHRYQVTGTGLTEAMFLTPPNHRLLRGGLAEFTETGSGADSVIGVIQGGG